MKKFSKILSVALLVALVLSLGVASAFAAEGDPTITITHGENYQSGNDSAARVYNVYKVFDASYDGLEGANAANTEDKPNNVDNFTYNDKAVSYTMDANSPWKTAILANGQTWVTATLSADQTKYIISANGSNLDSAADAADFAEYLAARIPSGVEPTEVTVDGDTVNLTDKGYYLIKAKDSVDAVTRLALVTTAVTLVEKNPYFTTKKETAETSYTVGQEITYTATVYIPEDTALTIADGSGYKAGHGPVILHDIMDPKLTFGGVNSVSAKIGDDTFSGFTPKTDVSETGTGKCTFEVEIPVTNDLLGKTIVFTYTAIINDKAADPDTGFVNTLFGELNGYKTTPDSPRVWTFDFDLDKDFNGVEDKDGDKYVATFQLRTTADDANTAIMFKTDATGYVVAEPDTIATFDTAEKQAAAKIITVDGNDLVNVRGLKAGTYYLVEIETATGYNKLTVPVEVTITDTTKTGDTDPSHSVSYKLVGADGDPATGTVTVVNSTGTVLPSTGGIGTTIFYVVGGVLVLAAIILLVTKKRMSE